MDGLKPPAYYKNLRFYLQKNILAGRSAIPVAGCWHGRLEKSGE
jgi:hypothetical protein